MLIEKTIVQEEVIEVELTPEEEETLLKLEALKTKSYILEELIDHYAWEKAGTKVLITFYLPFYFIYWILSFKAYFLKSTKRLD